MREVDLVIIGAGPAGLAAAIAAHEAGVEDILVIEREKRAGGILNQCIHDGFGLHKFGEALTGPEYAYRYIKKAAQLEIEIMSDSIVTDLSNDKVVTVVSKTEGYLEIKAKAVILAMGSRERTAGGISLPGKRPAGIYTAGLAQNMMNLQNVRVGNKVVILGSGDIGLIMARRLTLEGAKVEAVVELMPYSNGLPRNINQCLNDYGIPLKLSHTVTDIEGDDRLEAVTISKVDEKMQPVPGSEERIECDTLILSVGLIPENDLSRKAAVQLDDVTSGPLVKENLETNVPGVFACGNVLHVHDLVDFVSEEANKAGQSAAEYIKGSAEEMEEFIFVEAKEEIRYVIPQLVSKSKEQDFSLRVASPDSDRTVLFKVDDQIIYSKKFKKVNPSEMIKIKISADKLAEINSSTLEVVLR